MQIFVNGIVSGAAIALLAIAFQAVYLPTRVFFIGLAGIYSATPFLAKAARDAGCSWVLAVGISVAASVALTVLCEWVNHARLARRQASSGAHLISSLGIYLALVQIVAMLWGNDTKSLGSGLDTVFQFYGVVVTGAQLWTAGTTVFLLAVFSAVLMRSGLGMRLRALADSPEQLALMGYDVGRYRLVAFALSGVFVAASSLVSAHDVGFDAHVGLHAVLLAVVAVMIGGQGSFAGPVVGAILLGVVRAEVVWYWSPRGQEAVTFGLLVLILLLRPHGLLGRVSRLEALP